jgi:hypothetical protein
MYFGRSNPKHVSIFQRAISNKSMGFSILQLNRLTVVCLVLDVLIWQ